MADPVGVAIAFDQAWNVASPAWTRIDTLTGARVRGWSVDRGRPTEFDKTGTGTATATVIDRQGLFDPTNSGGYVITPGLQAAISLRNPVSDTWHTLFRGFVESWRYRLDRTRQYMQVELDLVDGFAILARHELRVGVDGALPLPAGIAEGNVGYGATVKADGVTPASVQDRLLAILGDVGYPAPLYVPDVDIFTGNVQVGPKAYGAGTSALDALMDAADSEFPGVANLFVGGPANGNSRAGHIVFHGRQARFRPDVVEYGIQKRDVGDPSVTVLDPDVVPIAELEWVYGYENMFNSCTALPQWVGDSSGGFRPLNPGAPDHDDVTANTVTADIAYTGQYGLRSLTFDNLGTVKGLASGNGPLAETALFAAYYAANYRDPQARISRLVFKTRRPGAANGSALWQHLCNCDISDLLTLKTEHPGGGGFDQQFYVEGLHYTGRPGPPDYPIVELSLDVSARAHWTTNPWDTDP